MRLLLDTHILLALISKRLPALHRPIADMVARSDANSYASVASLWEVAIKTRLGKLNPGMSLELLPLALDAVGLEILPIESSHALASVEPIPPTRDPFDRMLLAQCQVEGCRLVTLDRALRNHPLAARFDDVTAPTSGNPRTRP